MSLFLSQAVTALRKVENGENVSGFPLDKSDVAIIVVGLNRIIREGRTPFQRFRDHFIIGTERFPVLDGLDYLRTIIMHQKNTTRHSGTNLSEISAVEVFTALQVEPPQAYNSDPNDATPDEYAFDLSGFTQDSDMGPSSSSSLQVVLEPETIASLQKYVAELSSLESAAAIEKKQELEYWLRQQVPGTKSIEQGNLKGVVSAYHRKHFFYGTPRAFRKPSQNIADNVRKSVNYALDALRKNPLTSDIADHLERYCDIGQTCEYTGDLKWLFLKKL